MITSHTHYAAHKGKEQWKIDYESRADPLCQIAALLKEKGIMDIFIDTCAPPPGDNAPGGKYEVGVY